MCINYFGEDLPKCEAVDCYLDMTYMGTPSERPSIFTIVTNAMSRGSIYKIYEYSVIINKTNTSFVTVNATPVVGE
jgi:hypothetical protein